MNRYRLPLVIQSVGIACVPLHDMPPNDAALNRKPIAVGIVTLRAGERGKGIVTATSVSDARDMEFPLPWLVDQALESGAVVLISDEDRQILATEMLARRFWAEPKLSSVCGGANAVDPARAGIPTGDEAALCRRLSIPIPSVSDAEIQRRWSRHTPEPAETIALQRAVARLILWAHIEAARIAAPAPFFEMLLPLRAWMNAQTEGSVIAGIATSRAMLRAGSFVQEWLEHERKLDAGQAHDWGEFEDGLFHT